jgi:hypothetical protein
MKLLYVIKTNILSEPNVGKWCFVFIFNKRETRNKFWNKFCTV